MAYEVVLGNGQFHVYKNEIKIGTFIKVADFEAWIASDVTTRQFPSIATYDDGGALQSTSIDPSVKTAKDVIDPTAPANKVK